MKKKLTTARPLLALLVRWTVLAELALTLAAAGWYITGSYQKAGDEAQYAALRLCLALSLLLGISSFYGLTLDVFYVFRRKKAYLWGVLGYVLVMAAGTLVFLASALITGAAGGNR